MITRYLLQIILLAVAECANACVCFPIDSTSANELMNEVEFIIVGRAVKNVGFNSEVNGMWNHRNRGFNVLIQIDSVIQGNVELKTVIIKQFGGNCDQIFEFGEQYLIIGSQLDEFVNRTPKRRKTKEEEIPHTSIPPPPPSVYSKTAIFYNSSDEEVHFWSALAEEQVILNTSMCSSFYITSKIADYFLEN